MYQSEQSTNGEHCDKNDDVVTVSRPAEPDHKRMTDEQITSNDEVRAADDAV